MNEKSKIIKFPGIFSARNTSPGKYGEKLDDIESWEPRAKLIEEEDYPGLVRYCKQIVEQFPDDLYTQYYLGDAYVLNGEYEKAIEFLSEHHRKHPWNTDFQHVILKALFALGETENDFYWAEEPVILRMSKDIIDSCYELLRFKRKPRPVFMIYTEFVTEGYLHFTEEDLFNALVKDSRFIVEKLDEGPLFAEVKVARKGKK
jgi:tetratricopeptide (TPR) repeat protein